MRYLAAMLVLTTALPVHANEAQRLLSGMSETNRANAFAGMLSNSGENCGKVSRTFFRGPDKNNNVYWSVACSSGKSFQIQIKPDAGGSTTIADCTVLRAAAKIDCFAPFR